VTKETGPVLSFETMTPLLLLFLLTLLAVAAAAEYERPTEGRR
jgi:hypothetical protein